MWWVCFLLPGSAGSVLQGVILSTEPLLPRPAASGAQPSWEAEPQNQLQALGAGNECGHGWCMQARRLAGRPYLVWRSFHLRVKKKQVRYSSAMPIRMVSVTHLLMSMIS